MRNHTQGSPVATGNGLHIGTRCLATTHMEPQSERIADARRLAACWNACDGVSTEVLEDVNSSERELLHHYAATVAQRDELLAEFAAYKEGSEEAFGAVVDAKQALERRESQFESTIATQQRVIVDFRTQRDELLQALQGCALTMQALGVPVDAETRAAIAKATGRAA